MARLLLAGEDVRGALLQSVRPGLAEVCDVDVFDPARAAESHDRWTVRAKVQRRLVLRRAGDSLVEETATRKPDVVLLIKGRGVTAKHVEHIRARGTRVACWYPDNPFWKIGDSAALERLEACDLAITWSERQAAVLAKSARDVAVLPFGYDPAWFPLTEPGGDRWGVAFLGTWSERRERFLAALEGLPLFVAGTGWRERSRTVAGQGPVYEQDAGTILQRSAIGVNLLHPQCSGAHNMRTREIAASGALQITEPGTDGTPLRDGESCRWFETPETLRVVVEDSLADPSGSEKLARNAQDMVRGETYTERGRRLGEMCSAML